MSDSANIGRSDAVRLGRATAHNAPHSGGRAGILASHMCVVDIGISRSKQGYTAAAPAKTTNGIATAQAKLSAGSLTLDGAMASGGVAEFSPPRNVRVTSSSAGDTTQTATVTGLDAVGNAQTEDIAFNGAATIVGLKMFSKVTDISVSAAMAGNVSAGIGDKVGLPFKVDAESILKVNENGVDATFTPIAHGTTTGLGGFTPATVPDGSVIYTVLAHVFDDTESGYTP